MRDPKIDRAEKKIGRLFGAIWPEKVLAADFRGWTRTKSSNNRLLFIRADLRSSAASNFYASFI